MRNTKKEVQGMFARLIRAMNKKQDIGRPFEGMCLDYAPIYGGYVIEEVNKDTSVSHPFGCFRRNAREMYLSMWMATQVLENIEYEKARINSEQADKFTPIHGAIL